MATLFGIALNLKTSKLLASVEEHYGTAVQAVERKDLELHQIGHSFVNSAGIPVIEINPQTGHNETNIAHELFHLKLKADGFPCLEYQNFDAFVVSLLEGTWDPILHFIFYPKMREMGLDPDEVVRGDWVRIIGQGKKIRAPNGQEQALQYFKAMLEIANVEFSHRLQGSFRQWDPIAMALTERLVEVVQSGDPKTPNEAVDSLLKCMNILYECKSTFALAAPRTEQCGQHIQQVIRIVVIR